MCDRRKRRIGKRPPTDPSSFLGLSCLHVKTVKIAEVEICILIELVLDVLVHHLVEKPLRRLLASEGVQ